MIDREVAFGVVAASLRDTAEQFGMTAPADISDDTVIVGKDAVLDSIGVVTLIVNVEQKLEMDHSIAITLASDKAMSQRNSPFRTAGVLADYICEVVKEGETS